MSADSIALPRVKAKRRKRRPMTTAERVALWVAGLHAFFTLVFLLIAMRTSGPAHWIGVAEVVFLVFWGWAPTDGNAYRIVHNYIVNGYRDER